MAKFYIDGFTIGSNPSSEGGYTITDDHGNILKQRFVKASEGNYPTITNNYTEFLSLHDCLLDFCSTKDTIYTDSENSILWSKLRFSRKSKRKDLIPLAQKVNHLLSSKYVSLLWVSRDINLAGHVNEEMFQK